MVSSGKGSLHLGTGVKPCSRLGCPSIQTSFTLRGFTSPQQLKCKWKIDQFYWSNKCIYLLQSSEENFRPVLSSTTTLKPDVGSIVSLFLPMARLKDCPRDRFGQSGHHWGHLGLGLLLRVGLTVVERELFPTLDVFSDEHSHFSRLKHLSLSKNTIPLCF